MPGLVADASCANRLFRLKNHDPLCSFELPTNGFRMSLSYLPSGLPSRDQRTLFLRTENVAAALAKSLGVCWLTMKHEIQQKNAPGVK